MDRHRPTDCAVSLITQRSRTDCRLGTSFGCASCTDGAACGAAMWVQGGCRGLFRCNGREVACGQAGDRIGLGQRRCECWFDAQQVSLAVNTSREPRQGVFNLAYTWDAHSHTWWALGRYMQGAGHLGQCWRKHNRPENHSHYLALSNDATRAHLRWDAFHRLAVPPNAMCDNVGEPKWVTEPAVAALLGRASDTAAGTRVVYCYTNGRCDTANGWPRELPAGRRRETYVASLFGNYLFALPAVASLERTDDATLLSYTTPPDAADPSAKNFLFFAAQGALYAIALIEPHVVYSLHPLRGHDHVANMAPAHVTHTTFGFGHHLRLSLSGGPVRADERTFLVAAHVAVGGWWNAMRLTFFYAFDAEPPFKVRCATAPMSFGLSRTTPPLEYATHLELHDSVLYLSVGSDNCYSSLVQLPLNAVMARCQPLPLNKVP